MNSIVLVANTTWSMVKFRSSLLKELVKHGIKVYVVSPYDEYVLDIEKIGCNHIPIIIDNKGSNPMKDIRLVYGLLKIYNKINPDLIIHYTIKPNIFGTIAAKLARKKSFAVVTGLGYVFINDSFISKIAKVLYRLTFVYSDKVFFINEDDKRIFVQLALVNSEKTVILPSEGVNVDYFFPKKAVVDGKFRFLLIARMLWDKGVGEYVEAARLLTNNYPNLEFQLLGYLDVANPKAIGRNTMDKWIEEGVVNYLGEAKDVRDHIAKSNCIVLPSYREGVSMTLMESASMEKPLIATNVTGCKELIVHGVTGFLCKEKDSVDLAEKMENLIKLSTEEQVKMGKRGRKKISEEFNDKKVIKKYFENIKCLSLLEQS